MLLFQKMVHKGDKLTLTQLTEVLAHGLAQCKNTLEKKEFGMLALEAYDYEQDLEMDKFMKYEGDDQFAQQQRYASESLPIAENVRGAYFRNLIYRDDVISLLNIVWSPRVITPIHGHNCNGCWVLNVQGNLIEDTFRRTSNAKLMKTGTSVVTPGMIAYAHNTIGFHSIHNESFDTPAVTLH